MEWKENASRLHTFIKNASLTPPGIVCVWLNGLRIGVGLFRSETHKWNTACMAACECGTKKQTAGQLITSYPIYCQSNGVPTFSNVKKKLVTWLNETCSAI